MKIDEAKKRVQDRQAHLDKLNAELLKVSAALDALRAERGRAVLELIDDPGKEKTISVLDAR